MAEAFGRLGVDRPPTERELPGRVTPGRLTPESERFLEDVDLVGVAAVFGLLAVALEVAFNAVFDVAMGAALAVSVDPASSDF